MCSVVYFATCCETKSMEQCAHLAVIVICIDFDAVDVLPPTQPFNILKELPRITFSTLIHSYCHTMHHHIITLCKPFCRALGVSRFAIRYHNGIRFHVVSIGEHIGMALLNVVGYLFARGIFRCLLMPSVGQHLPPCSVNHRPARIKIQ